MAYVRLQLNLPNTLNTSQYGFCWTAIPLKRTYYTNEPSEKTAS